MKQFIRLTSSNNYNKSASSQLLPLMRMHSRFFIALTVCLFLATPQQLKGQSAIQLSGVVLSNDTLPQFIPFSYLRVKARGMGAVADEEGFFSLAVLAGDTVEFSHLGFEKQKLYVPDTLSKNKYLVQVFLKRDTTMLREVTLYPWPTPDRLMNHLLTMQIETTQMDIAQRNLAIQTLRERAASMGSDAAEIQKAAIKMQEASIYNGGRYYGANGGAAILGALTNPFAWAQFFESLKKKN